MKKLLIIFSVVFLLFACGELPENFHVNYYGNGQTSGFAPTDSTEYTSGQYATVKDKHTLVKTGSEFGGWNTKADNTGTHYDVGDQIEIRNINIFLYAVWNAQ